MRALADAERLRRFLREHVEIASPAHFIPELPGWRERSLLIERIGSVAFYHYDPYSQALAKVERGHARDMADVREFLVRGLVEPRRLRELFEAIQPQLHRYPAVDPPSFRKRLRTRFEPGHEPPHAALMGLIGTDHVPSAGFP